MPWLVRVALAARERELAERTACVAGDIARTNPGFATVSAAAEHARGVLDSDPSRLGWARLLMRTPGSARRQRRIWASCGSCATTAGRRRCLPGRRDGRLRSGRRCEGYGQGAAAPAPTGRAAPALGSASGPGRGLGKPHGHRAGDLRAGLARAEHQEVADRKYVSVHTLPSTCVRSSASSGSPRASSSRGLPSRTHRPRPTERTGGGPDSVPVADLRYRRRHSSLPWTAAAASHGPGARSAP